MFCFLSIRIIYPLSYLEMARTVSLFSESGEQWEIKKHSSLVQMGNITTLIERKSLNALIYIAKDQLKRNPNANVFTCDLNTIRRLTGWNNPNNSELKKALESLVDTKIKYNIFKKDNSQTW